jgi:lipoprotein-anchoring transpeptidase ErfK/SrfK
MYPVMLRLLRSVLLAMPLLSAFGAAPEARDRVPFHGQFQPGEIVISQSQRRLFFVLGDGTALSYRVAVGRAGQQWQGRAYIDAKHREVAWSPPDDVKRDRPWLPDVIPAGDPTNPMGARVLSLPGEYAIHGTTRDMRRSVGTAASYGCFRMLNEDIIDLFDRVRVGTPVTVLR